MHLFQLSFINLITLKVLSIILFCLTITVSFIGVCIILLWGLCKLESFIKGCKGL